MSVFTVRSHVEPTSTAVAASAPADQAPKTRPWWALSGLVAGVSGLVATVLTDQWARVGEERLAAGGAENVVPRLDATTYQVGAVAGLVCIASLLVFATGWRQAASASASGSMVADLVPSGLMLSAAAMVVPFGAKGALAVYLPGGMDEGKLAPDALYAMFTFQDAAPFVAWWGVALAAGALVVLGWRRLLVGRVVATLSLVYLVLPVFMLARYGEPNVFGLLGGLWLVALSVAVLLKRRLASAR
jgi:hypothetical protein